MTREEIANLEVPRLAKMLATLAEEIVQAAVEAKILSTKRLDRPRSWIHTVGRYAAFRHAGAWIGLTHNRWLELGRSPFWVAFQTGEWGRADEVRAALKEWYVAEPPRAYDRDGAVLVPLLVRENAEKGAVLRHIMDQLREIDAALERSGMSPMGAAAPPSEWRCQPSAAPAGFTNLTAPHLRDGAGEQTSASHWRRAGFMHGAERGSHRPRDHNHQSLASASFSETHRRHISGASCPPAPMG